MANTRLTQKEVISSFMAIHGDRYDYSKVVFVTTKLKVKIICKIHGEFEQTPNGHKRSNGCFDCGNISSGKKQLTNKKELISIFNKVHGDRYDYSKMIYKSKNEPVIIICKDHGEFYPTVGNHKRGRGCPTCGTISTGEKQQFTTEHVIKQFISVHKDKYDYSKVKYTGWNGKVKIVCKTHGIFKQTPSSHKRGAGCPACGDYGFNPNIPAILYYLSINDGQAYKIGITNRTIIERFRSQDLSKIKVLKTIRYEVGHDARAEELSILREFKYAKWKGEELLTTGNSELFDRDILMIDTA